MTKPTTRLICAMLSIATTTGLVAFADPASAVSHVTVASRPAMIAAAHADADHPG